MIRIPVIQGVSVGLPPDAVYTVINGDECRVYFAGDDIPYPPVEEPEPDA